MPNSASLPRELTQPMGIMRLLQALPGFESFLSSPTALGLFQAFTAGFLFMGMIGWKAKIALPAAAFFSLVMGGILRGYCYFYHTGLIPLYLLAVLACAPCSDALSLDSIQSGKKSRSSPAYGWFRYACWTAVAFSYMEAGLSKLRHGGLFWWHPESIRTLLYLDALNPRHFDWGMGLRLAQAPDSVLGALGLAVLAAEIFFPLVLFSRRARLVFPAGMTLIHATIFLFQNLLFFDMILLQLIFIDRAKAGEAAAPSDSASAPAAFWTPALVAAVLGLTWIFQVEYYPLSSMAMYSQRFRPPIHYLKVLSTSPGGVSSHFDLARATPALADARYRGVINSCFYPKRKNICYKYLKGAMLGYNQKVPAKDRIAGIEIQKWVWDFRNGTVQLDFGKMDSSFAVTQAVPMPENIDVHP